MSLDLSFLSSDPLLYFLAHSTVFVVSIAVLFFAFGLAFGWFTWARYKSQRRRLLAECELLKNEIATLKRKLAEQIARASSLAEASSHPVHAQPHHQGHAELDPVVNSFPGTAAVVQPREESELEQTMRVPAHHRREPLITPGGEAVRNMPQSQTETDAGQTLGDHTAADAAVYLISDPHLGLIYASRPALIDDLSRLKGVAHVIEGQLHELGVYTYKQIALWNDENIREFSNLLGFRDRIHREQWVEQARDLHHEKYGDRL